MLAGHRDLADACAEAVISHFCEALPNLRHAVIVTPHQLHHARLRRRLLEHAQTCGYTALLPPTIGTLGAIFLQRIPLRPETLSEHECILLIAEALHQHPQLLLHASRWEFAKQFLQLFDEVVETYSATLPMLPNTAAAAEVIRKVYEAWYTTQEKTPNVRTLYRASLERNTLLYENEHVFICSPGQLSKSEIAWANRLHAAGQLTLITCVRANGRYASPARRISGIIVGRALAPAVSEKPFSAFLDAAFSSDDTISARARVTRNRFAESPAHRRIGVFKPDTLEQHARGIYLQIRDWLDAGIVPVAVVSQDRKLSRRLRALLEQSNIPLRDHAGWALSTTSSAGALASLLPTSEKGFDRDSILMLARSPCCHYGIGDKRTQEAGDCLERQLAKVDPFRNIGEIVAMLLESEQQYRALEDARLIVRRIDNALSRLRNAMTNRKQPLAKLFEALFASMNMLGMTGGLRQDSAGETLLDELEIMAAAARKQSTRGNWNMWRGWILHTLENKRFSPEKYRYLVELYNLPQSTLARPGGVIIAALDTYHAIPSDPMPLLDEDTRQALAMNGRNWHLALRFDWFLTAMENAGKTLLTCQTADNGRTLTPAPWLSGLQHFHMLAYGNDLEKQTLRQRAEAASRTTTETVGAPVPGPQMPEPRMPGWDEKLSVRALQSALTCPYQFFTGKALGLDPAPETDKYDSPRTYGLIMHRCMAALHRKVDGLPGPMDRPWIEENRDHALELAHLIVETSFSPRVERHYSAAEGMRQTLKSIRWYVEWLIKNIDDDNARIEAEEHAERKFADGLLLYGRPDCVIHKTDGKHILDYKSRSAPKKPEMRKGKDVQLTAYALLYDDVLAVSYMNMRDCTEVKLGGKELEEAREKLREQLREFRSDTARLPFPAWASNQGCRYCNYGGVCRKKHWLPTEPEPPAGPEKVDCLRPA